MAEGHSRAGEAVWRWREAPTASARGVTPGAVLWKAAIGGLVAAALYFGLRRPVMAVVVAGISLVLLTSGFLAPGLYRALEKGFAALGHAAATALTWALLVPVYYLVFGTGRILLVLRGADPMRRRFPTREPSYWDEYHPDPDPKRYLRQH